jgi:peptide/nickel transport system substrate-binding protein
VNQNTIKRLIGAEGDGRLSRRSFVETFVAAGLTAPMAAMLLMDAGLAQSRPAHIYAPTKRGGGGVLRLLWWQAPTLLNPHFANGNKDQDASRISYEPLASWTEDGDLLPVLAARIPSREDGSVSADGLTVTWTLKQGVTWHDGRPFTADDVVF